MGLVTIIGGHGKIALLAAPLLAANGHRVAAVVRNPDHRADVRRAGAEPVVVDVERTDVDALTEVLRGTDVVVWSAGAGGGDTARTYAVDRDGAIRSMAAAEAAGVGRYVMVSYFGAGPRHGVPEGDPFFAYAEAKAAADERLRSSPLAWIILGPSGLTDGPPTGAIELGGSPSVTPSSVSRADVAAVITAVVERPHLSGRTIEFNNGPVAIHDSLDRIA